MQLWQCVLEFLIIYKINQVLLLYLCKNLTGPPIGVTMCDWESLYWDSSNRATVWLCAHLTTGWQCWTFQISQCCSNLFPRQRLTSVWESSRDISCLCSLSLCCNLRDDAQVYMYVAYPLCNFPKVLKNMWQQSFMTETHQNFLFYFKQKCHRVPPPALSDWLQYLSLILAYQR